MGHGSRRATIALLLACVGALAACGGSDPPPAPEAEPVASYEAGAPLRPVRTGREREGALRVTKITYRAPSGERVPALYAVPTNATPLGCLIYQSDLGTAKEAAVELRQGFAAARLATFTIDPLDTGQRGTPQELATRLSTPEGVRSLVLETVAELRTALDYLERRRECRDNIGYMGSGFGALVGTIVAAQDRRVTSTLLTSIGATWKQLLLVRPVASERIPNLPNYVPEAVSDLTVLDRAVEVLSPLDPERWIGRISPRPVMLMNGRFDPVVLPGDAMQLAAAAKSPSTILYYDGGHDPFGDEAPARETNLVRAGQFLVRTMDLPFPVVG